jgi:hypothetical protein
MAKRTFKIEIVAGRGGTCVVIDDYRVCGSKPWGGGSVVQSWTVPEAELMRALKIERPVTDPTDGGGNVR